MKVYVVSICDIDSVFYTEVNDEGKNSEYERYTYDWNIDSIFLDKDKAFEYCEKLSKDFDFYDSINDRGGHFCGWSEDNKSATWEYTTMALYDLDFLRIEEFEVTQ